MSKKAKEPSAVALARLRKEYKRLLKEPVENIEAAPRPGNMLEWHYVVTGPKGSLYEDGVYHGIVRFPPSYPYKPPSILMITPNGRFKTDSRLCLSMSDFHPETWNPLWNVGSILAGLLSFMLETSPTYGSIETTEATKRKLASESLAWNMRSALFKQLFPQYAERLEKQVAAQALAAKQKSGQRRVAQAPNAQVTKVSTQWLDLVVVLLAVTAMGFGLSFLY